MPNYSFNDKGDTYKTPGIVDNPSDREFAEYIEYFSSFIHITKCSLCNKLLPCLPMHLPFYREEVFVCAECVYGIHEHLAAFGYLQQIMDEDIRKGKIREHQTENGEVQYVPVDKLSSFDTD